MMKVRFIRQSGETGTVDVYMRIKSLPTEVLEQRILETFNSFEGVKSNPFISVKIMSKQKPLRAK